MSEEARGRYEIPNLQLKEMMWFSAILLVFLVSWGVAQHMLLYSDSRLSGWLVRDILVLPYWQMHNELYKESVIRVRHPHPHLYLHPLLCPRSPLPPSLLAHTCHRPTRSNYN